MNDHTSTRGFTLIELLIASMVFSFVILSVTQLFSDAMGLQRRAAGYQKIQDTAIFVLESLAREIRVSTILTASGCSATLTMDHPVNGTIVYAYDSGTHTISRTKDGVTSPITSTDVSVAAFSFCVADAGINDAQTRVTMPIKLEASTGRGATTVSVSLQTTVVSRDITEELSN